jgi:hypothetical protein
LRASSFCITEDRWLRTVPGEGHGDGQQVAGHRTARGHRVDERENDEGQPHQRRRDAGPAMGPA